MFFLSSSPKSTILGHVTNTGLYYDVNTYEEVSFSGGEVMLTQASNPPTYFGFSLEFVYSCQASEYEGIKIFHSNSSIYFANSDRYVNKLKEKVIQSHDVQI